jgi:antitoxin ParD1/3/4
MSATAQENALTITLPPDLAKLVNERVASGEYLRPEEVIREALYQLRGWEHTQELKREELRKAIAEGLQDLEEGRVSTKTAQQILEEIRAGRSNGKTACAP